MVGFGILAYQASKYESKTLMIVYGSLAILFQPVFKIVLGRELWNLVDVVVGIGLLVLIFIDKEKESPK